MKNRPGKTFEQRMYDIKHSNKVSMTFENLSKVGTQIRFENGKNDNPENGWGFRLEKNSQSIPNKTIQKIFKKCNWKIIRSGWNLDGIRQSTLTLIEII